MPCEISKWAVHLFCCQYCTFTHTNDRWKVTERKQDVRTNKRVRLDRFCFLSYTSVYLKNERNKRQKKTSRNHLFHFRLIHFLCIHFFCCWVFYFRKFALISWLGENVFNTVLRSSWIVEKILKEINRLVRIYFGVFQVCQQCK